MAEESASQKMTRAMKGSRFKSVPPIALDELKKIPGALRAHRLSLEVAHADAARTVRKLRRDLDKGEIGQERFAREVRAAWANAETVVQKRGEKIRELRERAVGGFDSGWSVLSVLATMASKSGDYAQFLRALPPDAQAAEVQRIANARDTERLAAAALVLEDLRSEIVEAIPMPQRDEARTFAAAAEREHAFANEWRERILKGDVAPPKAEKLHVAQTQAMQRFGAESLKDVEAAAHPRTDESIADYRVANDRLNQIETERAAEPPTTGSSNTPTTHSAPNGMNTMRVALGGEQK